MMSSVNSFEWCHSVTLGSHYIKEKNMETSFAVIKQLSIKKMQQCFLSVGQSTQSWSSFLQHRRK